MEGSNNARSKWFRKIRKRDATFFRMLEYSLLLRKPNRPDVPVSDLQEMFPVARNPFPAVSRGPNHVGRPGRGLYSSLITGR